jgi:Serine/threonine protein phosphatase
VVVLVLNSTGIHVGSLGDSRAVLATIPKDSFEIPLPSSNLPYRHPIQPTRLLNAIALTIDQKPNHELELLRIKEAGGVVQRVTNEIGIPIGPYRVWKRRGNVPGLAMSRSIGDKIAHEIGVISSPVINSFEYYSLYDQFIIAASDGIWDVMDNFEVVNLVENLETIAETPEVFIRPKFQILLLPGFCVKKLGIDDWESLKKKMS